MVRSLQSVHRPAFLCLAELLSLPVHPAPVSQCSRAETIHGRRLHAAVRRRSCCCLFSIYVRLWPPQCCTEPLKQNPREAYEMEKRRGRRTGSSLRGQSCGSVSSPIQCLTNGVAKEAHTKYEKWLSLWKARAHVHTKKRGRKNKENKIRKNENCSARSNWNT